MVEYKELQAVVRICGDYAAWHEIGIYCEYVFGYRDTLDDIGKAVCEKLDIDWDELENIELSDLEAHIHGIVQEDEGDYCDIEIKTVLCKIKDGEIVGTYLSI